MARGKDKPAAPLASYEDTLLAGELSDAQLDAIVAEFVTNSDITHIAHQLDLPRALVLRALEDGTLAERAMQAKKGAAVVRFMGAAIDQLLAVVEQPMAMSSGPEKIAAIKLLRELLGLRPTDRPRAAKAAGKEETPKTKQGALEAALMEDDDE